MGYWGIVQIFLFQIRGLPYASLLLFFALTQAGEAAQRKAYFSYVVRNELQTAEALPNEPNQKSSCIIVVNNPPDSQPQEITFAMDESSTQTLDASYAPSGAAVAATLNTTSSTCTMTPDYLMAPGASCVFVINFQDIPYNANVRQQILCAGSIYVKDAGTATSPGYLVASGSIISFTEGTTVNNQFVLDGTGTAYRTVNKVNTAFLVEEGRPF